MNYPPGTFGYERQRLERATEQHVAVVSDAMGKLKRLVEGTASINEIRSESGLRPLDGALARLRGGWRALGA